MGKIRSRWIWLAGLVLALAAPTRQAASVDLLVSNAGSGQISQIDGATGLPEGIFALGGADGLFVAAGLRLGTDGRLYVGSNGSVYRFDASTGAFIDKLETGLPGTGYFLALSADGSLFTNAFYGNQVVRFDGATWARSYIGGPPLVPTGLDIGPDGNLYVGDFAGNQVVRFNPTTGAPLGVFATVPIPGSAGAAGATRFGPDGRLYVALFNGGDIVRFEGTTGAYLGSFIPPGDPHPTNPSHLAWGPDGNLYVASSGSGEVMRYDGTTGAFLGVFASPPEVPWGLEFVPDLTPPISILPPIDTPSGPVQGFLARGARQYKGIPYAEAPTGERRWKRPERKAPWSTPLVAFGNGPACPQLSLSDSAFFGNEDCLRLAIWRPDAPPATPLPVLFFIHGGGFVVGSAGGGPIDGTNFAREQNVIVVEPQYRLGALGFLGLPELAAEDPDGSTGNYGFMDQLEALRWVRDNIAAFGGDPNQITIAGQSAGGMSVCVLMASPLSDGLFRAGIMQSSPGCAYAQPLTLPPASPVRNDPFPGATVYDRSNQVAANALVANPGCSGSTLSCLRALPAAELVKAYDALPHTIEGSAPAGPAIDGYVIAEKPIALLRQGAADHRPLVVGSVANESTYFTQGLEILVPNSAAYESFVRTRLGNTRADALLPLYPAASYPSPAEALRTLIEEAGFAVGPSLDVADAIAAGGSPAWVYYLTFQPTYLPTSTQSSLRTFHGLDLYYVFGTYGRLNADYGIATDGDDAALSISMQDAWGSLVKTGVPTTVPAWPVYAPATPGDLASVSVLNFDVPNSTIAGNLYRSGRYAALLPVVNFLDADRDMATYEKDNCPTLANTNQSDTESDLVGDVCDNCRNVANPRVAADFLTTNPWATLTGGQRDDDHDGYGNKCDAKFPGVTGALVGSGDLAQFRPSNGRNRTLDTCGTTGTRPCAIFDLDESSLLIGSPDLSQYRLLNGKAPGPKCATCPLTCTAGASGTCGAIP